MNQEAAPTMVFLNCSCDNFEAFLNCLFNSNGWVEFTKWG